MFGIKNEIQELPSLAEKDAVYASGLSAAVWMDMAKDSAAREKSIGGNVEPAFLDPTQELGKLFGEDTPRLTAKPDGKQILDPNIQNMIEDGLSRRDLQMDENGEITRAESEKHLEGSMPKESAVSSERRADDSLESVKFFDTANSTRQIFNFGINGKIESLSIQTASGGNQLIRFNDNGNALGSHTSVSVNRNSDGAINSFSLNDGPAHQTFTLDKSGNVLRINRTEAIIETGPGVEEIVSGIKISEATFADGNAVSRKTVTYNEEGRKVSSEYDDGFSNTKEFYNTAGEIVESYIRSDRLGVAIKNFEDRKERMTVRPNGSTRTTVDFDDGRTIETLLDPRKRESTITQKELDGSVFRTHETDSSITVKFTDAEGNWIRQVTNKASGITKQTRGDSNKQFDGVEVMRGA